MVKITNQMIAGLNPCQNRYRNYLKFYKNEVHSPKQFMGLKNITYKDKLYIAFKLLDIDLVKAIAIKISELVLHLYEMKHPNDTRIKDCIKATKQYNQGKITLKELKTKHNAGLDAFNGATDHAGATAAAYIACAAATCAILAHLAADTVANAAGDVVAISSLKQQKLIKIIILKSWRK